MGGAVLSAPFYVGQLLIAPSVGSSRLILLAATILILALGDLNAIAGNRLYPLTLHRQARKAIMYRPGGFAGTGFVWGLDAGLGFTTYRVTSGVWVLVLGIVAGVWAWWLLAVYTIGFATAVAGVTFAPLRTGASPRDQVAISRIMSVATKRRYAQVAYLAALLGVALTLAV